MNKFLFLIALAGLALLGQAANAAPGLPGIAKSGSSATQVRYRGRYRSSGRGMFRHWCAYNCYAVPPCCGPSFYGRYGYSHYAYDEDIPFRYSYDKDASPIDNAGALVYHFTTKPLIQPLERLY